VKNERYVMSRQGMVASAHSLITSTGLDILRQNGTAMDAAVAMALTAGVVLPDMCGIGGDAFFLYYEAKSGKIHALNGSGPSGSYQSIEFYTNQGLSTIPEHGVHSVSVPGAVSAYFEGWRRFGKLPMDVCAKDAIQLASTGYPLSAKTAEYIHKMNSLILQDTGLSKMLLTSAGLPKTARSLIKNPPLAETLRELCSIHDIGFYHKYADHFSVILNRDGNQFEANDFKNFRAEWVEPIKIAYRDHWVYQLPPISQGIIHLEMLNILKHTKLNEYLEQASEVIHLMVEAKKIAFEDRITHFGDPIRNNNPVEEVLSAEYGKAMAKTIDMYQTRTVDVDPLNHWANNTTSMVVVDREGNACSMITSISDTFGSCVLDEETGIIFNNRVGTNFNMVLGHPNCIAPLTRTMNTLNAFIITDSKNRCRFVSNTPGGDRQPQWNAQTTFHLLDQKLNVIEALDQPYWYDAQTTNPYNKHLPNILYIEKRAGEAVLEALRAKGHQVEPIDRCNAAIQLIEITPEGVLCGATDWRAEGVVIGY
jgi:gamma-glutamyltranspeptidase / glutathione hydrolase